MLTPRLRVLSVAASLALASNTSSAVASPITYTFVQTASGTLGGVPFSSKTVTTTVTADTSTVTPPLGPSGWVFNLPTSGNGTVSISDVGTFDLFDALVVSTNTSFFGADNLPDPTILYSMVLVATLDSPPVFPGDFTHFQAGVIDPAGADPFYGYDLTTALGPVAALAVQPATGGGVPVDYDTSGGPLVITSNDGTTTFTATGGTGASTFIPGGPLDSPVTLDNGIKRVTGMIGGSTTEAFYRFYWPGGAFSATASVGATDPLAIYAFKLFSRDPFAFVTQALLMGSNGFSDTISLPLLAGAYSIGIDADNLVDPPFSITFGTPVSGTVPEPATLVLLGAGLASSLGVRHRRRVRR